MVTAAVLAGGTGSRMGADKPKQFLEVGSVPIIILSIKAFINNENVDGCIVAVNEEYTAYTKELIKKHIKTDKNISVIKGGSFRGETLLKVLEFMKKENCLEGILLTHDAVRPFIDDRIINGNIEAAKQYGACNTCIKAVDTVFISADGKFIDSVPDRNTLFHAQTPQSFDAVKLYELIKATDKEVFEKMTDGCSVFTYHGKKVAITEGSNDNIKITFPEDMKRAEMILKGRE